MNYKEEYFKAKKEITRLGLKLRSKDGVIRSITKKLGISDPNLANNLKRMNFEELLILEEHLQ